MILLLLSDGPENVPTTHSSWIETHGPLAISLAALAFAFFSFWWNTGRRGRLIVSPPRTFALSLGMDGRFLLLLPLAVRNTAPLPLIIRAIRITIPAADTIVAHFIRTRKTVEPSDDVSFATNLVVAGREGRVIFCEFEARVPTDWATPVGSLSLKLEILYDHRTKWTSSGYIPIWVDANAWRVAREGYIAHDNINAFPK